MTAETRTIRELLAGWAAAVAGTDHPAPPAYDGPDVRLTGFVEHTDLAAPGACFVARVRATSDGHPYIGQAVARGASLVLGQRPRAEVADQLAGTPYLQAADTAVAVAWLAAAWHGFPGQQLLVIGVTGTDGKSTTANFLQAILERAGFRCGLLSTIRAIIGGEEEPLALHVTTPEAPVVQAYLRRMVAAGLTHCVLEATSHGLAQNRVSAVGFDLAVVTNITHEHLDYHGDYASYFAAKSRLFQELDRQALAWPAAAPAKKQVQRTAVLNGDDDSLAGLAAIPAPRRLVYNLAPGNAVADIRAEQVNAGPDGVRFQLHLPGRPPIDVTGRLPGAFNAANMLAAATAALALEVDSQTIADGLAAVQALSGRMEPIDSDRPFRIVVDFAHTPNALRQALTAARAMTEGRVIVVFGSAGKRDVAKRRLMAEVAGRLADQTVLTAEDPRTEPLEAILAMMAEGCQSQGGREGETFWRVPDRGQAIHFALGLARAGDLVLVCGKGHEQSMCFGLAEYPWDDRQAVRAALEAIQNGQPMPDLGLPTYLEAGRRLAPGQANAPPGG